jgi:hypothetical protein
MSIWISPSRSSLARTSFSTLGHWIDHAVANSRAQGDPQEADSALWLVAVFFQRKKHSTRSLTRLYPRQCPRIGT